MDEDVACGADDVTTPGDGQAWQKLFLDGSGTYEVQWDTAAAVTPMGALVYFAQYLSAGGVLGRLCADCPLTYHSGNAPKRRDVIGTVVLAVLNGQTRYAHINTLRQDRVSAQVLNLKKVVSEDRVRRAFGRGAPEAWDVWLQRHERMVWEPLLSEPYVLDIDNTVKPLYGHQEGAELGYNPKQPGRPSHNYHTYFVGSLRLPPSTEFDFVQVLEPGPCYEYIVLVSNTAHPILALGQLYRDRADCENVFDEIKNQWGWAGFVTQDLRRCRIMARLIALVYNWWNIFTRLAQPDRHLEAVTSRPLLLHAVGRLVTTARRKILRLTSTHAMAARIQVVLSRIGECFNRLKNAAEQLSPEAIWAVILSVAFRVWLKGKALHPVAEGPQMLLWLRT